MTLLSEVKNLYIRKGDTGQVTFTGLPQDKLYSLYLSIYDPDKYKIIKEISGLYTQAEGTVTFSFSSSITDDLPVGEWEYAVKMCDLDGTEDTIVPRAYVDDAGKIVVEEAPAFTVGEKLVEGTI